MCLCHFGPDRRPSTPGGRWWWGTKWLTPAEESSPRGWWTSESWTNRPRSSTTSSKSPAYSHVPPVRTCLQFQLCSAKNCIYHFCFLTTGNWEPVKAPLTRRSSAISSWSLWPSMTSGEMSGRNCVAPAWGWVLVRFPSPHSNFQCFPLVFNIQLGGNCWTIVHVVFILSCPSDWPTVNTTSPKRLKGFIQIWCPVEYYYDSNYDCFTQMSKRIK